MRAAAEFGMEVTREAVKRGVRISAGSDHVAYGPVGERASLFGELQLLVDSIALTPDRRAPGGHARRRAAIGGEAGRQIGTIEAGRYADLVLLEQESAGGHRQPRLGGVGDARRADLAAGAAAERDRDAVELRGADASDPDLAAAAVTPLRSR